MDIVEYFEMVTDLKLMDWQKEYVKRLCGICKDRSEETWKYITRTIGRGSNKRSIYAMYTYIIGAYRYGWHENNKRRRFNLPMYRHRLIKRARKEFRKD